MPKKKKKPTSHEVTETTHVEGITYQKRYVRCGKERCRKGCADGVPSHGPYWYAVGWNPTTGKSFTVYKGKELPKLETLLAQPEHQR